MSSHRDAPDNESDGRSGPRDSIEKATADVPQVILQNAKLVSERGNIVTKDGIVLSTQEVDASLAANIFLDPDVRAYYVDVYEKAQYECRHAFDPDLTWTKEEEKKLVRKLDWHGKFSL